MNCLWCDQEIMVQTSWTNFLIPSGRRLLCESCASSLQVIAGSRCKRCSRETSEEVCHDCCEWGRRNKDPLEWNYSIFTYNDTMKEMVARWKYRGDYMVGNAFAEQLRKAYQNKCKQLPDHLIIPIPLSEERLVERRFNQAKMLAEFTSVNKVKNDILFRVHSEKQSKKTRKERIEARNPFHIEKPVNKPVILIDDIYTTGTTLRFAADVLKQAGSPQIYSLTLIRG